MIRLANQMDKIPVLNFCQNTFSWGDYIEHVWNYWLSEGSLFVYEKQYPVGICHAFYSNNQIWIEGIRIDSHFRQQKIASHLIAKAESDGKKFNASFSYMLIETENSISISMANSLNYEVFQTWNFYSLEPSKNSNFHVELEKSLDRKVYSNYVKSWRWFPMDNDVFLELSKQEKIIKSVVDNKKSSAILVSSEHFDKTLIVTLFSDSTDSTKQIILFLQNYAIENNYERIQILTKEKLSIFDSLEHKLSFYLMKKPLF